MSFTKKYLNSSNDVRFHGIFSSIYYCTFLSHFLAHYFKKDKTKKSGKKKFIVEHPMENHQSTTPTYEELGLFVQSTKISLSSTSSSARSSPRPSLKIRRPSNSNTKAQEKKSTSMSTKDSMEKM